MNSLEQRIDDKLTALAEKDSVIKLMRTLTKHEVMSIALAGAEAMVEDIAAAHAAHNQQETTTDDHE